MTKFNKVFSGKLFRVIAVLIAVITVVSLAGYQATIARPGFCAMCHMMKPEYYTHQASRHAKQSCSSCHITASPTGWKDAAVSVAKNISSLALGTYISPIKMGKPIDDAACESCHRLKKQTVIKKLDLVINHEAHKKAGIQCAKCHKGIAHGQIADRKVTYESDYKRWDAEFGKSLISEQRYIRPQMETCKRCHMLRKITLRCKDCHASGKLPLSHKIPDFIDKVHGRNAYQDLKICDYCHNSSSDEPVEIFKPEETYKQYLGSSEPMKMEEHVIEYSRQNTFCRTCHGKLPKSHKPGDFSQTHGRLAKNNEERCLTCHDRRSATGAGGVELAQKPPHAVTRTYCGKCHPSIHSVNAQWKMGFHPVPLPNPPKIIKLCYDCHQQEQCAKCHGKLK